MLRSGGAGASVDRGLRSFFARPHHSCLQPCPPVVLSLSSGSTSRRSRETCILIWMRLELFQGRATASFTRTEHERWKCCKIEHAMIHRNCTISRRWAYDRQVPIPSKSNLLLHQPGLFNLEEPCASCSSHRWTSLLESKSSLDPLITSLSRCGRVFFCGFHLFLLFVHDVLVCQHPISWNVSWTRLPCKLVDLGSTECTGGRKGKR